jgi:hypothetical protein
VILKELLRLRKDERSGGVPMGVLPRLLLPMPEDVLEQSGRCTQGLDMVRSEAGAWRRTKKILFGDVGQALPLGIDSQRANLLPGSIGVPCGDRFCIGAELVWHAGKPSPGPVAKLHQPVAGTEFINYYTDAVAGAGAEATLGLFNDDIGNMRDS